DPDPARARRDLVMGGKPDEGIGRIDRRDLHMSAGTAEDADVEDQQDGDFGDEGDAQDGGGKLDVEIGQHRYQHYHEQRQIGPLDVDVEEIDDLQVHEIGEA